MGNKSHYKRKLVISDIHGCYDEFNALLRKVDYNPAEDELILLGDYCDRGLKSKEVIELLIDLQNEWNITCLCGNHDQMFIDCLNNEDDDLFLMNGGIHTINSYCGMNWFENGFDYELFQKAKKYIMQHYKNHFEFLNTLSYYYETEEFLFVHAGINPYYKDWKKTSNNELLWIRDPFHKNPTNTDKTVIFGHTPTLYLHETEDIWFDKKHGDKIGIDGGCCFGYQLNCLEISDDGYKEYFVVKG